MDGHTVEKLTVPETREFSIAVPAPREFGLHSITLGNASSGTVIDGMMFIVGPEDKR
jgi:hypothetical protein